MNTNKSSPWWRTRSGLVLIGFLAVGGFYLIVEHRAHAFGVLPYLLILACPILHLFHHHGGKDGHGGHQHSNGPEDDDDRSGKAGS